jgi:predicted nucleic acid-binding Zn ribbon protein
MSSPGKLSMERAGRLFGKSRLMSQVADPETRARAAWPVAAGQKVARHTRATSLVRSTLVVEVGDAVWQRQLSTLRYALLRNLAKELGEALVTEIDFRPMPARRQPQRAESARPANPDNIEDPVLAMLYDRSRRMAQ